MKNKLFVLLIAAFAVLNTSCKKKSEDNPAPKVNDEGSIDSSGNAPGTPAASVKNDSLYMVKYTSIKLMAQLDPSLGPLANASRYNVNLYKVQYLTEYQGSEVMASGIVAIPDNSNMQWPVLSFHHGTVFADSDAPSNNPADQMVIAAVASAGYVVAAPDYLGFGSSAGITHPYYMARYSASTARDLLTATRQLLAEKSLKMNGKLFLTGYSQGGNVTLAVAKSIEERPLEGYNLIASAAGAGGYNMEGIFKNITTRTQYSSPNYIAYIVQSYRKSYQWSIPLSYYFQDPYAEKIPALINGKTESAEINQSLTSDLGALIQPGFIADVNSGKDSVFVAALKENSLHNWKPVKPLRLYHGDADEVVPFSDSEQTYATMVNNGSSSVAFFPLQGNNHGSGAVPMMAAVIQWFNTL